MHHKFDQERHGIVAGGDHASKWGKCVEHRRGKWLISFYKDMTKDIEGHAWIPRKDLRRIDTYTVPEREFMRLLAL